MSTSVKHIVSSIKDYEVHYLLVSSYKIAIGKEWKWWKGLNLNYLKLFSYTKLAEAEVELLLFWRTHCSIQPQLKKSASARGNRCLVRFCNPYAGKPSTHQEQRFCKSFTLSFASGAVLMWRVT